MLCRPCGPAAFPDACQPVADATGRSCIGPSALGRRCGFAQGSVSRDVRGQSAKGGLAQRCGGAGSGDPGTAVWCARAGRVRLWRANPAPEGSWVLSALNPIRFDYEHEHEHRCAEHEWRREHEWGAFAAASSRAGDGFSTSHQVTWPAAASAEPSNRSAARFRRGHRDRHRTGPGNTSGARPAMLFAARGQPHFGERFHSLRPAADSMV